jgi:hypothetical protein
MTKREFKKLMCELFGRATPSAIRLLLPAEDRRIVRSDTMKKRVAIARRMDALLDAGERPVVAAIRREAASMNVSFETAREIYYSRKRLCRGEAARLLSSLKRDGSGGIGGGI